MQVAIQCGWGMKQLALDLVKSWSGGTVVLSPRDMTERQLVAFGAHVKQARNVRLFVDPQCYSKQSDHPRLCQHGYWPSDFSTKTMDSGGFETLIADLASLNYQIGTRELVLPVELMRDTSLLTMRRLRRAISVARKLPESPAFRVSIPISSKILQSHAAAMELIEALRTVAFSRAYVVFEPPSESHWIEDPVWVENVLHVCADFRMRGVDTIVGFASPQMLVLAAAGVRMICCGTWSSMRSFSVKRYSKVEPSEKRTTQWLYVDAAMTEYKRRAIAKVKDEPVFAKIAESTYSSGPKIRAMFKSRDVTALLTMSVAFRHYMESIYNQASLIKDDVYDDAQKSVDSLLANAMKTNVELRRGGLISDGRDPKKMIVATMEALSAFRKKRAPLLRRHWDRADDF